MKAHTGAAEPRYPESCFLFFNDNYDLDVRSIENELIQKDCLEKYTYYHYSALRFALWLILCSSCFEETVV